MPTELSMPLPLHERSACRDTMSGYINWKTDRSLVRASVDHCLSLALHALSRRSGADAVKLRALATAFRRANAWTAMPPDRMNAARDRAMADQLQAFRRGLKTGTKIIVWTANAHAAYGGYEIGKTLAQITRERMGSRLFTVGVSAAAGEYRWSKSEVRQIPASAPSELEHMILADRSAAVAASAELQKLGTVQGTALSWHKPLAADWSTLFDAVYVIAREEPTTLLPGQ